MWFMYFKSRSALLRRLPTCHYERQKASSTGLLLKPMLLEEQFLGELQNVSNCRNNIGHLFFLVRWTMYLQGLAALLPQKLCWNCRRPVKLLQGLDLKGVPKLLLRQCCFCFLCFGPVKFLERRKAWKVWTQKVLASVLFLFSFWKGTNFDEFDVLWYKVFPKMIGHLTTEMIWLMGVLATSSSAPISRMILQPPRMNQGATRMTTISSNLRWHRVDPPVQLTPMTSEELGRLGSWGALAWFYGPTGKKV